MRQTSFVVLILFASLLFGCSSTSSDTPTPSPTPSPTPTPSPKPNPDASLIDVSKLGGVYDMTSINYGTLPEVRGVGSLTVTALSDTSVQVSHNRSYTLVSTDEVESLNSRDTCKINRNASINDNNNVVTDRGFSYTRSSGGLWGYFSVSTDLPKKARINETLKMVQKIPAYKDRTITQQSIYSRK